MCNNSVGDVPDKWCEMTFDRFYVGYHTASLHKTAVYLLALRLCLRNGSHITLNYAFHCFVMGTANLKPIQLSYKYNTHARWDFKCHVIMLYEGCTGCKG